MIGLIIFILVALFVWGCESGNQADATYHHRLNALQKNAYTYKDGNIDRLLDTGEKVSVVGNKIYNKQGLVVDIDEANRQKQIERLDEMCEGKYNFRPVVLPPSMYKYETTGAGSTFCQILVDDQNRLFKFVEVAPPLKPNEIGCLYSSSHIPKKSKWYYRRRYVVDKQKHFQGFVFAENWSDSIEEFDHDINLEMSRIRNEVKKYLRCVY